MRNWLAVAGGLALGIGFNDFLFVLNHPGHSDEVWWAAIAITLGIGWLVTAYRPEPRSFWPAIKVAIIVWFLIPLGIVLAIAASLYGFLVIAALASAAIG
jgi:hypothetical protein